MIDSCIVGLLPCSATLTSAPRGGRWRRGTSSRYTSSAARCARVRKTPFHLWSSRNRQYYSSKCSICGGHLRSNIAYYWNTIVYGGCNVVRSRGRKSPHVLRGVLCIYGRRRALGTPTRRFPQRPKNIHLTTLHCKQCNGAQFTEIPSFDLMEIVKEGICVHWWLCAQWCVQYIFR